MPVPTRKTHQLIIEDILDIKTTANTTCIDAVIEYCSRNNIEPDSIVKVLKSSKPLIALIESEAIGLHYIRRDAELAEE